MARNAEGDAGSEVEAFQATGDSLRGTCPSFLPLDGLSLRVSHPRNGDLLVMTFVGEYLCSFYNHFFEF